LILNNKMKKFPCYFNACIKSYNKIKNLNKHMLNDHQNEIE
jgi:hypothetical protein